MNYEEMSKPELCALVAKAWFDDVIQHGSNCDGSIYLDRASEEHLVDFDPIDNPSDAWPIIFENGISIDFWGDFWGADIQIDGEIAFEHEDKNPLRAACICFLKMKDEEK